MHSLIIFGMTVLMTYALFADDIADLVVKPRTKTTIIYCESCRKQKEHIMIDHGLFECMKCKRHIDLRAS